MNSGLSFPAIDAFAGCFREMQGLPPQLFAESHFAAGS
jgi:hypothetical protein